MTKFEIHKDSREFLDEQNQRALTPLKEEYLNKIQRWRNRQMEILRQYRPLTSFNQKQWYAEAMGDERQILFGLVSTESGQNSNLIGYCGLVYIDQKNRRAEISFLVEPERARDKKIYREDFLASLFMLNRYAFEELNLIKVYAETFEFRNYHIELLEEFGFQLEGKLRRHHFTKGKYWDSYIHSFLSEEWDKREEEIESEFNR